MDYLSVKETAKRWKVSERMVRLYCTEKRVPKAEYRDGNWYIPSNARKPKREVAKKTELQGIAKKVVYQKERNNHFGIYEYIQVNLAYSSCRMASNRMTREQVLDIYRTGRVSVAFEPMKVDDMIEINNHFWVMRYVVDNLGNPLTQSMIKKIHTLLCYGTEADREGGVRCGEYRQRHGKFGVSPTVISQELSALIEGYETRKSVNLDTILDFHVRLEKIHPFDDYNGRVGRVIMMKECLRYCIDPFIIDDKRRGAYNKGIARWASEPQVLRAPVLEAQARLQKQLELCKLMQYCRQ